MEEETIEGEALTSVLTGSGVQGKTHTEDEMPPTPKESEAPGEKPSPQPKKPGQGLAWEAPSSLDPGD